MILSLSPSFADNFWSSPASTEGVAQIEVHNRQTLTRPKATSGLESKLQVLRITTRPFVREAQHLEKLRAFALAEPPLCELFAEGIELPNQVAFKTAFQILLALEECELEPLDIVPSGEGGIAFIFEAASQSTGRPPYADIECLNSGSVIATIDDWNAPAQVWLVPKEEWLDAIGRIRTAISTASSLPALV